jgi:hypothetical protein
MRKLAAKLPSPPRVAFHLIAKVVPDIVARWQCHDSHEPAGHGWRINGYAVISSLD